MKNEEKSRRQRKRYSKEFRANAVKMVMELSAKKKGSRKKGVEKKGSGVIFAGTYTT